MQVLQQPLDARFFQMAFQFVFLSYGMFVLQWTTPWYHYLLYTGTALLVQWLADVARGGSVFAPWNWYQQGWKSALISSLSLCLLLKTNQWYICVLAAVLTVLSKVFLRYKGRHFFNPSAFAIVATILLTGQAWLSPAQWGSGTVIFFAVCCLGLIVVTRVQQLDLTLTFLATFCGLLFVRQVWYLNWSADVWLQSVSTGSLLLFSFFMISDPRTAPDHPAVRLLWAAGIGIVSFYLAAFRFMNSTPLFVLVFAAPLVPLLNHWWQHRSFRWSALQQTTLTKAA